MRGIPNVSFIFLDEYAYFPESQEVRIVSERYAGKSNCYIVACSTPNTEWDEFAKIEMESEEECFYKKIFLPWTVGAGKIYSKEDIEIAKKSPSFEREYNLKYLGELGDVFNPEDINRAVELGKEVNYTIPDQFAPAKSMGIDPAYGGKSKFAIVVTQINHINKRIEVLVAEQYDNTRPSRSIEVCADIIKRYYIDTVFIDASEPGLVSDLKELMGEDPIRENWEARLREIKQIPGSLEWDYMHVIPVNFDRKTGADMIVNVQNVMSLGALAIPEVFKDLVVQMRIAKGTIDGRLDKHKYSMDLLDALRLYLRHYNVTPLYPLPQQKE